MTTIKTTVYLDEADYRAVQTLAAAGGVSSAELIRRTLHELVSSGTSIASRQVVAESSPRYRAATSTPASVPLPSVADRLAEIQAIVRDASVPDPRSADEILGYDERGLPV